MKDLIPAVVLVLAIGLCVMGRETTEISASSPHDYFNSLVARADHWKSFSLRDQAQLLQYKNASSLPPSVTYEPATDPDPHRQDAAKVVIPAFAWNSRQPTLTAGVPTSSSGAVEFITMTSGGYADGRALKIGPEIMTVVRLTGEVSSETVRVRRGQYGTAAVAHSVGTPVLASNNSLVNQVRLPLGTSDGNSYLFTWDAYWTDSYLNTGLINHKTFQFSSSKTGDSGTDMFWLEPNTNYETNEHACWNDSTFAGVHVRSYNESLGGPADWTLTNGNVLGPGVTNRTPIEPKSGDFCQTVNTWTRFWVLIEQRANDYDYMDMWVADENQNPIQIYRRVPLSVRTTGGTPNQIYSFWFEFNTSTDNHVRGNTRDLVAYIRNFVVLRNVASPTSVLQRPGVNEPLPPLSVPRAPQNPRILGS